MYGSLCVINYGSGTPYFFKPKHKNALGFVHNLTAQNFPNCKNIWTCCRKKAILLQKPNETI